MKIQTKLLLMFAVVALCGASVHASVTFSGTALVQSSGSLGFLAGQTAVFINNNNNTAWNNLLGADKLTNGVSLFTSSTYTPIGTSDSFTFLTNYTTSASAVSGNLTALNYSGGFSAGDEFAVLIFSNSTSTTVAGDTYRIFRGTNSATNGGWVMPVDGLTLTYNTNPVAGSSVQQIRSTAFFVGSGTVVPEPSTYALLAMSGLGLAGYMVRRRRRS